MDSFISYRCPRCGKALCKSDLEEYDFQCTDCDEDFYQFETEKAVVTVEDPTQKDMWDMNAVGVMTDLKDRKKVTLRVGEHSAYSYIEIKRLEKLGMEYVAAHVELLWSDFMEEYYLNLSENDYYNDQSRNPDKEIPVEFVEIEAGTGWEVYRGIDSKQYYLREPSHREPFAKWLVCGKEYFSDVGRDPRANLIFRLGNQTEKVTYHDWNGVCAYENTFNPNFRHDER